jgi:hypothetical protein
MEFPESVSVAKRVDVFPRSKTAVNIPLMCRMNREKESNLKRGIAYIPISRDSSMLHATCLRKPHLSLETLAQNDL